MERVYDQRQIRLLGIALFGMLALSIGAGLVFREPWLWMDEVLSYVFLSDPSMAHMNGSIISSMDANPPLYFDLFWLIGHTFSLDPLFLRMLSVLLFAGTITLFYGYTTRLVGNPVANFVLISAMIYFTYQNFAHATGIRFYALLFPISCVYFILMHQLIDRPDNVRLLVLHTVVGTLLAFCHNYGLFYLIASGVFFGGLWLWSKQRSYVLILGTHALIAVIWLVVWYPNFVVQANAGKPHSWIPLPTVQSVFFAIGDLMPNPTERLENKPGFGWLRFLRVTLIVGLFVFIAVPKLKAGYAALRRDRAFQFFLMGGVVYLTTIAIALVISLTYTSILIGRYMWPSELLIMYQLVYAGDRLLKQRNWVPRLARWIPLYALLLGGVVFYKVWKMQLPFQSRILTYLPQLSAQYPVFVERADYFLPIWFHKQRPNVAFLLDWEDAIRPDNIRNATVDFKVLKTLRERYRVPNVVPLNQFNRTNFPHFYVIDEQNVYQMEDFIKKGRIKVIRELPIAMAGHRLLECSF